MTPKHLILGAAVLLGGCASFATVVAAADVQIQTAVELACGFEPTLASLDTLISTDFPTLWTTADANEVNSIAKSICTAEVAALNPPASARRAAVVRRLALTPVPVTVGGVVIQFVVQ